MTNYKKLIHFFGEMDLDLSKTSGQVFKKAFDIAENCGYMVTKRSGKDGFNPNKIDNTITRITLYGLEGEIFKLWFKNGKFVFVTHSDDQKNAIEIPSGEGTGYGGYF